MTGIKNLKLGLFGGTFDPIHNGHLAAARAVLEDLSLDKIMFIPAGQPWLKEGRPITPAAHRLTMVQLAVAGEPRFEVSNIEIIRPGATYTVDTLIEILEDRGPLELYVILGWDALNDLPRWKDPARLIQMSRIVAVPRPGYRLPDLTAMEKELPGLKERLIILEGPRIKMSSSDIRRRIADGLPFAEEVPEAVAAYIRANRLYA
jgi:nicotinate-nucleotide adenylyltransferase